MSNSINGRAFAPADLATRQRTATLRRSCEACRNVKARCVLDSTRTTDTARCCKRCINQGIDCVFENALARPKKLKYSSRTRVKDVEEKLDGLIALISARKEAASESPLSAPGAPVVPSGSAIEAAARAQDCFDASALGIGNIVFPAPIGLSFDYDGMSFLNEAGSSSTPNTGHSLTPLYGDVIDRGFMQENLASALFAKFTTSSEKQFPFTPMPAYAKLGYMRRERPFTLLAILTVTADMPLQLRLALEYRKALAQAMIVESKSSLDLLQSILIFCIWHHQYFRPYSSQLYQLSQIAVTMAVEINLPNTISPTLTSLMAPNQKVLNLRLRSNCTPTEQMANEIERARTFLGTYCLSASIATAHRKPTHFKYDRRMDQACEFLSKAQELPSDIHLVPYHVQIRKLAEDVDRVFGNLDQGGTSLDAMYIEAMIRDFERQYEQLRLSVPSQSWSNAALKCAMLYLPVSIYEVALRMPPEHQAVLETSPNVQCCNWCGSSTRLMLLMKCITASQAYITGYLDLPTEDARHVTVVEISRHVDAILVLSRIGLGIDTKNVEHGALATNRASLLATADVARYLEASERKMASLITATNNAECVPGQEEKHDLFWQLKHIFQISVCWYHKHVHQHPDGPKVQVEIEAHELAKLDVSPIVWISEGTTMARFQCSMAKAAAKEQEPAKTSSSFAYGTVREVDRISSVSCQLKHAETRAHAEHTPTDASTNSTPVLISKSTLSSSAPMVTPESNGSGFDSLLDAGVDVTGLDSTSMEPIPSWSMDQSVDFFANIPQSNLTPPWFSL